MTMQDFIVVGSGTLIIFVLFLIYGWVQEAGAINLWPIVRRYVAVHLAEPVPGDERTSSMGGSAGSRDLVPGQQHHVEPVEPGDREPLRESFARQLEKEELIILLAVQRNDDGDYRYSANQITAFVGGAAAPVKATIANVRGKKETPPPPTSLHRPINGW